MDSLARSTAHIATFELSLSKTREALDGLTRSIENAAAFEPTVSKAREAMASLTVPVTDALKSIELNNGSALAKLASSYRTQDWYSQHQRIMESLALEGIRPIATAVSMESAFSSVKRLAEANGFAQQSISSFLDIQADYMRTMRSTMGSTASQFASLNFGIGKIIADLSSMSELGQISIAPLEGMMPRIEAIAGSYKVYARQALKHFEEAPLILAKAAVWDVAIPTWTTANFISTVRQAAIKQGRVTEKNEALPRIGLGEQEAQIRSLLFSVHPKFVDMWDGAWIVLKSHSPDSVRQSAHSARELLMQLLAHLAPDRAFTPEEIGKNGHEGRPTRKMRVRKILGSKSATEWVEATALAADAMYAYLASVSHDRSDALGGKDRELVGVLVTLGGLVLFVISSKKIS